MPDPKRAIEHKRRSSPFPSERERTLRIATYKQTGIARFHHTSLDTDQASEKRQTTCAGTAPEPDAPILTHPLPHPHLPLERHREGSSPTSGRNRRGVAANLSRSTGCRIRKNRDRRISKPSEKRMSVKIGQDVTTIREDRDGTQISFPEPSRGWRP